MAAIAILYPPVLANQNHPGTRVASRIAGAAITAGLVSYVDSNGKSQVADASSSGKQQPDGIIGFQDAGSGLVCTSIRQGLVAGYDLSALAFGDLAYLDTVGTLNTVANGTKTVVVGRVVPTSEIDSTGAITKLLDVNMNPLANF